MAEDFIKIKITIFAQIQRLMSQESDLSYYSKKLPGPLRNKYVFVGLLFFAWMLFFDRNNVISQIRLHNALSGIKNKLEYHHKSKDESDQTWNDIFTNDASQEYFARSKYFFKRDNEDVFVFEKDK